MCANSKAPVTQAPAHKCAYEQKCIASVCQLHILLCVAKSCVQPDVVKAAMFLEARPCRDTSQAR